MCVTQTAQEDAHLLGGCTHPTLDDGFDLAGNRLAEEFAIRSQTGVELPTQRVYRHLEVPLEPLKGCAADFLVLCLRLDDRRNGGQPLEEGLRHLACPSLD